MSKITFTDSAVPATMGKILLSASLGPNVYVASNGIVVSTLTAQFHAVHGGMHHVRDFNGEIAPNWERRRVNEFADHVAATAAAAQKPRRRKKVA